MLIKKEEKLVAKVKTGNIKNKKTKKQKKQETPKMGQWLPLSPIAD